jgi:predicted enzyme related to lactoylglutathione lyase
MLFMIVERFKNGDPVPVYQRFRERGRLAPEGLHYVSSWVDVTLETCYQVMETSNMALIDQWIANWADLVECDVVPVMTSKEAAAKLVGAERPRTPATPFGGATPIFRVQNLEASVEYYVNVLGVTVDWQDPGIIASVSRDRCGIFLTEGDQGQPGTWVWIGVPDIEPLFEDSRRKGARVRQPPTNFRWAYEMQIEDLDGHVLRIGSESKEGQAFGPWFDMHGRSWGPAPEGAWKRVS